MVFGYCDDGWGVFQEFQDAPGFSPALLVHCPRGDKDMLTSACRENGGPVSRGSNKRNKDKQFLKQEIFFLKFNFDFFVTLFFYCILLFIKEKNIIIFIRIIIKWPWFQLLLITTVYSSLSKILKISNIIWLKNYNLGWWLNSA